MKKHFAFVICAALIGAIQAQAEIIELDPITVAESGVWVETLKAQLEAEGNPYAPENNDRTWCRELKDIPHTFVCAAFNTQTINRAFSRISIFAEGMTDWPPGVVYSWNDPSTRYPMLIGPAGHDLRFSDVQKFYRELDAVCAQDKSLCPEAIETTLRSYIETRDVGGNDATIISIGLDERSYKNILSHELIHAQYFQNPKFAEVIRGYWDAHHEDKEWIGFVRSELGQFYDLTNPLVMMNEVAAYSLGQPATHSMMAQRRAEFADELTERADALGVKILQPEWAP